MANKLCVLCIDDDAQIRYALGQLCESQGWQAELAKDVKEGLAIFSKKQVDIVVTDYHLPNISGVEGVQMLRKKSTTVPIIVFTIDDNQEVADAFLQAGANDFGAVQAQHRVYRGIQSKLFAQCICHRFGFGHATFLGNHVDVVIAVGVAGSKMTFCYTQKQILASGFKLEDLIGWHIQSLLCACCAFILVHFLININRKDKKSALLFKRTVFL